MSPKMASLLPALVSISCTPGLFFLAYLCDHAVSVHTLVLISSLGAALAVFLLWGLAQSSLAVLIVFTIMYGFFAGGFSAVYAAIAKELRMAMDQRQASGRYSGAAGADLGAIFGLLGLGRGLGFLVAGPVSEMLLKGDTGSYGSGYGPLIVFVGATMVATMGSTAPGFIAV
jgi:hypothetical protein